jgi:predicted nucleic acid-binding protein
LTAPPGNHDLGGVLVDTSVIVYAAGEGEVAERCRAILAAIAAGELTGRCSTAIMEEVWHLELSGRLPGLEGHTALAHEALSPLLPITDEVFTLARDLDAPRLGANDRIHVATCAANDLTAIISADRGFDTAGEVRRIDPFSDEIGAALAPAGQAGSPTDPQREPELVSRVR